MSKAIYDVEAKPPVVKSIFYGLQHLLACFGATVLVPILVGIPPDRAIFSAGLGTLLYLVITKFKVPNFVGSSFAFIAVGAVAFGLGPAYLAIGALSSCLTYVIIALIVWKAGSGWVGKVLPPVVIGSVVAIIGLSLAGTAVNMAFQTTDLFGVAHFSPQALLIAAVTLALIFLAMYSKNSFISSISILIGLVGGYLVTIILGNITDSSAGFKQFLTFKWDGHWFNNPLDFFVNPFDVKPAQAGIVAISFVITSFATICEHIGHTLVTGDIIGRDLVKKPGLHRTILGDGLATGLAGIFGSVSNTTYGESLGVMATTKVYSVAVFIWASIIAIVLSLIAPFGEIVKSLPTPVLGGACILLYGTIAANGLKQLITNKVDVDNKRNMIIVSLIFTLGVGGAMIPISFQGRELDLLSAVALSALVGIALNLILPRKE
ncbi:MAG: purine/pyrimidine permease [Spirochaetaceae bacterium]|jgi:uracil permease|nr:purine/pyrimidine permease [Spirochaetaceae bacterium]